MQTIIEIVCTKGKSIRDIITIDSHLEKNYYLRILNKRKIGRKPGWTKIRGTGEGRHGTINIHWNANVSTLMCRVVNRGAGKPNHVIGDFIDYMLARHKYRVKHITIWSR